MAYSRVIVVILAAFFLGSVISQPPTAASPHVVDNSPAQLPEPPSPVLVPMPTPVAEPPSPVLAPTPSPAVNPPSPVPTPFPVTSPPSPATPAPVYPPSWPPSILTPPSIAPAPQNDAESVRLPMGSIAFGAFVIALLA